MFGPFFDRALAPDEGFDRAKNDGGLLGIQPARAPENARGFDICDLDGLTIEGDGKPAWARSSNPPPSRGGEWRVFAPSP
jgi:hypothetical protein